LILIHLILGILSEKRTTTHRLISLAAEETTALSRLRLIHLTAEQSALVVLLLIYAAKKSLALALLLLLLLRLISKKS